MLSSATLLFCVLATVLAGDLGPEAEAAIKECHAGYPLTEAEYKQLKQLPPWSEASSNLQKFPNCLQEIAEKMKLPISDEEKKVMAACDASVDATEDKYQKAYNMMACALKAKQ